LEDEVEWQRLQLALTNWRGTFVDVLVLPGVNFNVSSTTAPKMTFL
jgi:hypothetical protein